MSAKHTAEEVEAYLSQLNAGEPIKQQFRRFGLAYPWFVVFTTMMATVATLLSSTIINVAIPDIMGTYGIGQDEAQWLSTANLAAATVGMLLTSWLVPTFGQRLTILGTMFVFMLGAVIGGLSPNLNVMILARILQGVTAGIVVPLGSTIIFQMFPPSKHGMAMGTASIGAILAPALGPTIGGLLVDAFNWRYVFFLGIPFSLICLPMAALFLPDRDHDVPKVPFDWWGLGLLTVSIVSLLLALSNGVKEGWSSSIILFEFALFAFAGVAFVLWQQRARAALLNLQVFKHRGFVVMAVVSFLFGGGLYGSTYLLPLFLQLVQNKSAIDAGLVMMPAGLMLAVVFPVAGRMADRFDHRWLISFGVVIFAYSFWLMTHSHPDTNFWMFAWWLLVGRIGIGLVMPPVSVGALRALPPELLHQGSGVLSFIRQLGGAFGVNLISVLLTYRTQFHVDALYATQGMENGATSEVLGVLRHELVAAGLTQLEQWSVAIQHLAQSIALQAMVFSFRDSFWVLTFAFLVALLPVWWLDKNQTNSSDS